MFMGFSTNETNMEGAGVGSEVGERVEVVVVVGGALGRRGRPRLGPAEHSSAPGGAGHATASWKPLTGWGEGLVGEDHGVRLSP